MLERNNQSSARRNDDMLRRTLFGGNGNRHSPIYPQARPVMEQIAPQEIGNAGTNGNEAENAPFRTCINACSLAMVYSPIQEWKDLFPLEKALCAGTLFRELDKPFEGRTLLGR